MGAKREESRDAVAQPSPYGKELRDGTAELAEKERSAIGRSRALLQCSSTSTMQQSGPG